MCRTSWIGMEVQCGQPHFPPYPRACFLAILASLGDTALQARTPEAPGCPRCIVRSSRNSGRGLKGSGRRRRKLELGAANPSHMADLYDKHVLIAPRIKFLEPVMTLIACLKAGRGNIFQQNAKRHQVAKVETARA